ncbi:MAG TPA: zinc ribbon domain-containing protein [Methanocella sp.]|nr:zinc ribbon domain-containing protein [Methanocella sp.]
MLITVTKLKAESAGTVVALVNPADTSKLCLRCGLLVEKKLSDCAHECPGCSLVTGRDENVAVNILRGGIAVCWLTSCRSPLA